MATVTRFPDKKVSKARKLKWNGALDEEPASVTILPVFRKTDSETAARERNRNIAMQNRRLAERYSIKRSRPRTKRNLDEEERKFSRMLLPDLFYV